MQLATCEIGGGEAAIAVALVAIGFHNYGFILALASVTLCLYQCSITMVCVGGV